MERRIIHTSITEDDWFKSLSPNERWLFVAILIKASRIGIFKCSIKALEDATGLTEKQIDPILTKFAKDGKVFYIENYIIIENHTRYYSVENHNQAVGFINDLDALPPSITKHKQVQSALEKLTLKIMEKIDLESVSWMSKQQLETLYQQFTNRCQTVYKPLPNPKKPLSTLKEKETVTEKGTVKLKKTPTLPTGKGSLKGEVGRLVQEGYSEAPPAGEEECKAKGITQIVGCVYLSDEDFTRFNDDYGWDKLNAIAEDVDNYCRKEDIYPKNPYAMMVKFAKKQEQSNAS